MVATLVSKKVMRTIIFAAILLVIWLFRFTNPTLGDFEDFVSSDLVNKPSKRHETTCSRVHNYIFCSVYEYAVYNQSGKKEIAIRYFAMAENFWFQEKIAY